MYQHELLDRAREICGSDYRVSKEIGVTAAAISSLRNGYGVMKPDTAIRLAELIGADPVVVLVGIERERAERANSPTAATWADIARRVSAAAVVMSLSIVGVSAGISDVHASPLPRYVLDQSIHYANFGARFARALLRLINHLRNAAHGIVPALAVGMSSCAV